MLRLVDREAHWIDPPVLDVDEPIPKYLPPYVVANLERKLQERGGSRVFHDTAIPC